MQLSAIEQRIIGCLLEKQSTTPEHYPLSLNALTNACNQKSNRDPVMNLTESEVQSALDGLIQQRLVTATEGLSGRVSKYDHRFCNTEFSHIQFNPQQRAIMCLLLLRGAQTPGELRTRSNRLTEFNQVSEVETTLDQLIANDYVAKLAREPGKRESRYMHLFTTQPTMIEHSSSASQLTNDELNELQAQVDQLKEQLLQIKSHLGL